MENAIHDLQVITGIKADVLGEILLVTPALQKTIKRDHDFSSKLENLFSATNLDKYQFGMLFANHPSSFADIKYLTELASTLSKSFPLPYSVCLSSAIKNQNTDGKPTPSSIIENFSNIFYDLGLTSYELSNIVEKYPNLISVSRKDIEANLSLLMTTYKVQKNQMHDIIITQPKILLCSDLKKRMMTAKTLFCFDASETASFLKNYYSLLFVPRQQITDMVSYLSHEFYFSDLELSSILRLYPELCLQSKTKMREVVKALMKHVGMSSVDIKNIIKAFPRVLSLSHETIKNKYYELYNSELFVKLDIKSLICLRPEILACDLSNISKNILDVCRVFDIETKKQASMFIRNCLKFVSGGEIRSKLIFLDSQGITLGLLRNIPSLLDSNQNLLAIKYNSLEPFGLSYYLDSAEKLDYHELISRIKFLSLSGLDMSHIELSHSDFQLAHGYDSEKLMNDFYVSKPEYKNLINIEHNTNIVKSHFARMLKTNYISDLKVVSNAVNKVTTNTQYKGTISAVLETLGLESYDARKIGNMLPEFITPANVVSVIEVLSKAQISREQIIKIIEKFPSILTSPIMTLQKELDSNRDYIEANKFCLSSNI